MTASTIADLETPTSLFLKLRDFKPAFLLESVTHGEKVGRYSFIGLDPIKTIEYRGEGGLRELIERELAAMGTVPAGDCPRLRAGETHPTRDGQRDRFTDRLRG